VTQVWRVARYRFRATFARRWGGLVALVLLIALVGGLAMGSIAAARRTQSSYPAYLARTNASDIQVGTALDVPGVENIAYDPALVAKIARLPHVAQVASATGVDPNIEPLVPLHLHQLPGSTPPVLTGSLDGAYSRLDRLTFTSGRPADPRRLDEVVMSASAARELGMHVGSVLPMGFFTNAQLRLQGCCTANGKGKLAPHLKVDLRLVGIAVFNTELIEDDIDSLGDVPVILSPALMAKLVLCCSFYTTTGIKVEGGNRNVPAVRAEIARAAPNLAKIGAFSSATYTSVAEQKAERAVEPESIALGVFGAIAALAVLLIAVQLIGRQLRRESDERAVLRALGASSATTIGDGLFGVIGAVTLGALLAGVVAVALSPIGPLGPVRPVEHPGIAFDWTVLALGIGGLIVVLSAIAVVIGYRQAPHLAPLRRRPARTRRSRAARAAASAGFPTPTVTGIRFALEPGAGPNAVPVRSAIVGAVLAMVVVVSTLTFGTSLHTLVSRPTLYGWNWNYELLSGFAGQEDLPQKQVTTLLDRDPYVSQWSGIYFASAEIDGTSVAAIAGTPGAPVAPPLLSGHGLEHPNEVVLGASTLAALHKHLGDKVTVVGGLAKPTTLTIVGTATMPAIGNATFHTTMGSGALFSYQLIPPSQRNLQGNTIPGPQAILVRVRKSARPSAALRSLQQISATINKSPESPAGGVAGVMRPAEIVNYRSMGTTPALLGAALAAGAIAALMLTLIASVRRRRRELALLKTLGFTHRQLAAVLAWQSTIAVGLGVVIGVPLGIITGRALWDLFAHAIHVVDEPTVPALAITLVAIGALVLANVVATLPGLQAARTRTAVLLRAE
jgi:hypothetical protein